MASFTEIIQFYRPTATCSFLHHWHFLLCEWRNNLLLHFQLQQNGGAPKELTMPFIVRMRLLLSPQLPFLTFSMPVTGNPLMLFHSSWDRWEKHLLFTSLAKGYTIILLLLCSLIISRICVFGAVHLHSHSCEIGSSGCVLAAAASQLTRIGLPAWRCMVHLCRQTQHSCGCML